MKVAFQAGVLQVWLDEADLHFAHVDGASGGVFNLAMYCQGLSGTQIADNWRKTQPLLGLDLNWHQYERLFYAQSLFTLEAFRRHVFSTWGLDWCTIQASPCEGTFNVYNFSKHELEVLDPKDMTEDYLCACVSLPMWFPPVVINGNTYIDAVYVTDANLEEAIRRGADEIWVIWTVSDRGEWQNGFVANYFQIIEASANGHFKRVCHRIEENNATLAGGKAGEFGRPIALYILKAEVPLHYLINFSADRLVETVNLGVQRAREWCTQQGIPFTPGAADMPTDVHTALTRLQFTEEMKGFLTLGEVDYDRGYRQGRQDNTALMFHLTITIDGVNRFITDPQHEAGAEGYVQCSVLGGQRPVEHGVFNLFVDSVDPSRKAMYYRLFFSDGAGNPLTLLGFKDIKDDPGADVWTDTTTLFTRILQGHVGPNDDSGAKSVAGGILHLLVPDFLKQLTTFHIEGPTLVDRAAALGRFGRLFLGKLWDVYARYVL